jgi:RNA polymerase sigma-70 factor (ECF subfamily)
LLALLLLTSARTSARTDADGNPVTLADQDRTRWNPAAIAEGSAWLSQAVVRSGGVAGPYQIQAHLAAAHSTVPSWQETLAPSEVEQRLLEGRLRTVRSELG